MLFVRAQNYIHDADAFLPIEKGDYVLIEFQDQGVGISDKNIRKIFDPFYSTKSSGRGLGLATAYSIIKNHKGYIDVRSTPGEGTLFKIYIPADKDAQVEPILDNKKVPHGKGRVLVMDDEEFIIKIVMNLLKKLGYSVEVTNSGEQAVELYKRANAEKRRFDAVILDLTVPGGMGGKEAVGKILEIDPDAGAIVSNGYSNDPVISDYESYGFSGRLEKPFSFQELGNVMRAVIEKPRKI